MDELELLLRARGHIEKLANGLNPFTECELEDDSLLNDVRMSRCFFFVSDILRRVIEHGAEPQKKKKEEKKSRLEFALTLEQKERVRVSETPLPISVITNNLNEAMDNPEYKKTSYITIQNYLTGEGYLMPHDDGTREIRVPTEKGNALGITREKRESPAGRVYLVNLYNLAAQEFIIEHINEM